MQNGVLLTYVVYFSGNPFCPVKSFLKYISKLNPKKNDLWQRPKDSYSLEDDVLYVNAAVGKNKSSSFMMDISKIALLSCEYRNHFVRATCITALDIARISGRHIMKVSGHKTETSLKSYSHYVSDTKKREISETLSTALGQTDVKETEENLPNLDIDDIENIFNESYEMEPVNDNQCGDSNLKHILRELPSVENKPVARKSQNVASSTDQTQSVVQKMQNQMDISSSGFFNFRPYFSDNFNVINK